MKSLKPITLAVLLLGGLVLVRAEDEPPTVDVVEPRSVQVPNDIDLMGRVQVESLDLRARINGVVHKVHVRPGAAVKKGDVLVEFDTKLLQPEIDRATAAHNAAETRVKRLEPQVKRVKVLRDTRSMSEQELEQIEGDHREAVAQVAVTKVALETAQGTVAFCKVVAPADGIVGPRVVAEGSHTFRDETPLVSIQRTASRVIFEGDDRVAIRLRRAAEAKGQALEKADLAVQVGLPDVPEFRFEATLDSFASQRMGDRLRLELGAALKKADALLLPGMLVRVRVLMNDPCTRLAVPRVAVEVRDGAPAGQAVVLVLDGKDRLQRRPVLLRPGPWPAGSVVIEKGLAETDRVVASPARNLPDGAAVTPRSSK